MAPLLLFKSLIFSQFLLLVIAHVEKCPSSFECGYLGTIRFPFTISQRPHCGVLAIHGCDDQNPDAPNSIRLSNTRHVLYVESHTIAIKDEILQSYLRSKSCKIFSNNYTLPPSSPLGSVRVMNDNITLFRCNHSLNVTLRQNNYNYTKCPEYNVYYSPQNIGRLSSLTPCSKIQLTRKDESDTTTTDPFSLLSDEIFMEIQLSDDCRKCIDRERGQCQLDSQGKFYCVRGMHLQI